MRFDLDASDADLECAETTADVTEKVTEAGFSASRVNTILEHKLRVYGNFKVRYSFAADRSELQQYIFGARRHHLPVYVAHTRTLQPKLSNYFQMRLVCVRVSEQ